MPFNPMVGTNAAFKIGVTSFAFSKWEFSAQVGLPKVTNFTGGGARQIIPGVLEGTVTVSGPYDEGNMPFTVGAIYTVLCYWNATINLSITGVLKSIKASQDVEEVGKVELTFESTGTFTAAIT